MPPAYVLRHNDRFEFFPPYFSLVSNSLFKYLFQPFEISFIEASTWSGTKLNQIIHESSKADKTERFNKNESNNNKP